MGHELNDGELDQAMDEMNTSGEGANVNHDNEVDFDEFQQVG